MTTSKPQPAARASTSNTLRRWAVRGVLFGLLVVALVMADLVVTWLRYSPRIRRLVHESPGLTTQMRRDGVTAAPQWVGLEDIPGVLACAVLISEDPRFLSYSGVDWRRQVQIVRIIMEGDRSPGGSGIAQQLARTLYLTPALTPRRKLREWLLAINIGRVLSRERQLELYLNVAQWGPAAWGAAQGARDLLGKSLDRLTPSDALLLAVVLPAPRRGLTFALRRERRSHIDRLVFRLWERGVLTEVEAGAAGARLHAWIGATEAGGAPAAGLHHVASMFGQESPWRGPPMPTLGCLEHARWPP